MTFFREYHRLVDKMTDTKGSSESIKEWKDYVRAHWDYVQLRP